MNAAICARRFWHVLPVVAVLLLAGCETAPMINWGTRVGHYTFDQAVVELGPPDKQARLTDGTTVAEWLTRRGRTVSFVSSGSGYSWPYGYGPVYPATVDTATLPDFYMRLTFGADGQLKAWQKFAR